jgi:hypothetical protein
MSSFVASPTMESFMLSDKYVRVLGGPIGGGKSVCCAHELMRWATLQKPNADGVRKTRFLIVRNTADQLKSTTLKTIIDWFPPEVYGSYSKTDKTLTYVLRLPDDTIVHTEWMLIALDTPDDVRKALSLEATGLWGNESRELHPEVVDGLLMRVNRYPSMKDGGITRAGAIFDTNMPDEDTWWEKKFTTPPRNWSVHIQPSAVLRLENWIETYEKDPPEAETMQDAEGDWWATDPACDNYKNLEKSYYPNTLEGKTQDFIRVYLRCEFGRSLGGLPVYEKSFSYERHIAKSKLHTLPSEEYPLVVGMDFGRTPCAVIMQMTPRGTINVLSEVTSENMGIQKFVKTKLKPHLFEKYAGMPFVVAPDPAGWDKTQVNELCPCDILEAEGFKLVKPPTNRTGMRIEAVETVLSQSSDSYPRLQIDRACVTLIQGFRGKYKWKTNKQGELSNNKEPDKNHPWSDVHDALQYATMVIDAGLVAGKKLRKGRRKPVQRVSHAGWT